MIHSMSEMKKSNILKFTMNAKPVFRSQHPPMKFLRNENVYSSPKKCFEFINIQSEPSNIPRNIVSNFTYKGFENFQVPSKIKHADEKLSRLLNVCYFLYENGGIYTNKVMNILDIFIKNAEVVVYNPDFFSCEKKSTIIQKLINKLTTMTEYNDSKIMEIFAKEKCHRLNNSFLFLIQ